MKCVITVFRWVILVIRVVVILVLLPFALLYYLAKKSVSSYRFKTQLKKSGIPKDWVKKLTRQYSPGFSEILELSKKIKT